MGLVGLRVQHMVSEQELGLFDRGIPSFKDYLKEQLAHALAKVLLDKYAVFKERENNGLIVFEAWLTVDDPSVQPTPIVVEVKQ